MSRFGRNGGFIVAVFATAYILRTLTAQYVLSFGGTVMQDIDEQTVGDGLDEFQYDSIITSSTMRSGDDVYLNDTSDTTETVANGTIGKATMLYGEYNKVYERALQTHLEHARRHGYPLMILRRKLLGRVWTKPAYILSIILSELQKPRDQRLRWLFWFDADTVLINPKIPLDLFIPPSPDFDHIHFLCGSDHNGLNAGTFLVRTSEYSLHLVAAALTVESFRPGVDLRFSDQSALEHIISSKDFVRPFDNFTYADGYARIPQRWINAYLGPRTEQGVVRPGKQIMGNSLKEGDMLVHFAGHGDTKQKRMTRFMDALEKDREAWAIDVNDTDYGLEIKEFWRDFRKSKPS